MYVLSIQDNKMSSHITPQGDNSIFLSEKVHLMNKLTVASETSSDIFFLKALNIPTYMFYPLVLISNP